MYTVEAQSGTNIKKKKKKKKIIQVANINPLTIYKICILNIYSNLIDYHYKILHILQILQYYTFKYNNINYENTIL